MNNLFYTLVRPLVKGLFFLLFRPRIKGKENIPKDENYILAGNHTKWLDPVMLVAVVKNQIHFLAKDSLFKGITKPIVKGMGAIPVNRKIHDKNALNSAIDILNENKVIGIFPEGTINKTDDIIMPFKIGAVKMASTTNSTLVPFTIKNKYKVFKKSVILEFYKPYKINTKNRDLTDENKHLMNIISNELRK